LERLLRLLLVLLGIGIGLALFQVGIEWYNLAYKDAGIPAWIPGAGYTGMGILGGLVFLLLSGRILRRFTMLSGEMQRSLDRMPLNQLMSAVIGLILGLILVAIACVGGLGIGVLDLPVILIVILCLFWFKKKKWM
jgi:uncharacterized protein YacL